MEINFKDISEMQDHFKNRTKYHIGLVQKYAKAIEYKYPKEFNGLFQQSLSHDSTKFEEPEYSPYVHIAWKHKLAGDGKVYDPPETIGNMMNNATHHHVKHNAHHPESHSNQKIEIDVSNRKQLPKEIVDATKMPPLAIGEMVADWMAMAEEKHNDPIDWADKNVNIRWKFTDKQKNMIYSLINNIWEGK
jgi:hypothetical protein